MSEYNTRFRNRKVAYFLARESINNMKKVDPFIQSTWSRALYAYGNKKRALEVMDNVIEQTKDKKYIHMKEDMIEKAKKKKS